MRKIIYCWTILFLVFSCSGQNTSGGTTILLLISKDSIWIAADSRVTQKIGERIVGVKYRQKIQISNGLYFVVGGDLTTISKFSGSVEETILDVPAIMLKKSAEYRNIDTILRRAADSITYRLSELMRIAPESWQADIINKEGKKLITAIMVTNSGSLEYRAFDVGYILGKGFQYKELEFTEIKPQLYSYGKNEEIKKELAKNPRKIKQDSIASYLSYLINLEKEANPNEVGGTTDILLIKNDGHAWLINNKY